MRGGLISASAHLPKAPAYHTCSPSRRAAVDSTPAAAADDGARGARWPPGATQVLVDPFCGCGTALAIANLHGLRAIGVDLSGAQARKARRLDGAMLVHHNANDARKARRFDGGAGQASGGAPGSGRYRGALLVAAVMGFGAGVGCGRGGFEIA